MARFALDARGNAIVVDLPEVVVPMHRDNRQRSRLIAATLPDGRTAWVAVNVLCTNGDGSRYAQVHYGERLYSNALLRLARQMAVRRQEAALMYRAALAA